MFSQLGNKHTQHWKCMAVRRRSRYRPTTVAWPFSDFFQNISELLETSKKRCLTVGRRSRDLRPLSRDRSATFFKNFANCLKRQKNVVWQSADSRLTEHCRVTVQRHFRNISELLETLKKQCLTIGRRSRDRQLLPRDRSATFFNNFRNCLKRWKNVLCQSADGRVTSDHCRVPFSDFFRNFSELLLLSYARSILYAETFIPQPLFHYSIILSPLFFKNVSAPICFELRTHLPVE